MCGHVEWLKELDIDVTHMSKEGQKYKKNQTQLSFFFAHFFELLVRQPHFCLAGLIADFAAGLIAGLAICDTIFITLKIAIDLLG